MRNRNCNALDNLWLKYWYVGTVTGGLPLYLSYLHCNPGSNILRLHMSRTPLGYYLALSASMIAIPAGSPSCGGVSQFMSELTHSFLSVLVSVSIFMALSTLFHSINSPNNSVLSLCSAGLISALLLLSTVYFFMKVFFSPDVILCGCLGLENQLTN